MAGRRAATYGLTAGLDLAHCAAAYLRALEARGFRHGSLIDSPEGARTDEAGGRTRQVVLRHEAGDTRNLSQRQARRDADGVGRNVAGLFEEDVPRDSYVVADVHSLRIRRTREVDDA